MSTPTDTERIAREWASVRLARDEAEVEFRSLDDRLDELSAELRARLSEGEAADAGPLGWVVLAPPAKRLPARVAADAVTRYAEQLMELGLVREERTLTRPKVADLRANAARLAAHGVPLNEVVKEPVASPALELVRKDGDA